MEGRCRPIMGARSAWHLLSFKIRFPISDCSFFNLDNRAGVSIQVSHPYNRMGMTKTSNKLSPVSGFRTPWKASNKLSPVSGFRTPWKEPMEPRIKKAWCTFDMLSSTDLNGLRSCCHHTLRHLACDCVSMVVPATSMHGVRREGAHRKFWQLQFY